MIKIGDYFLSKRDNGKIQISHWHDMHLLDSGEFDEKDLAEVIDKFYREKF